MIYDFRVGDYVELKDGRLGYPSSNYGNSWTVELKDNGAIGFFMDDNFQKDFNRIGKYDFTKIEHKRVGSMSLKKSPTISEIVGKINELVRIVNFIQGGYEYND